LLATKLNKEGSGAVELSGWTWKVWKQRSWLLWKLRRTEGFQ